MKIGIIISQTDPETVWNALRFSNTAILEGHQVEIFLLGAGVEIEKIKSEKFNVQEQLTKFNELSGTMLAGHHMLSNPEARQGVSSLKN
jgi:uncharacterized protein involved in oxidation of intracellular sulfur